MTVHFWPSLLILRGLFSSNLSICSTPTRHYKYSDKTTTNIGFYAMLAKEYIDDNLQDHSTS